MGAIQQGPASKKLPLLPYEKQLIDLLGWSEDEYQYFQSELAKRQGPRPAEYAHIPDIVNEPATTTAILVNLAIGLVLTGVSLLLAPKPQQPDDGPQQRTLDSNTGPNRFNSTFGFGTQSELAAYGSAVPLIFGYFDPADNPSELVNTGGIVATPKLVWSRMLSYGTYQLVQAMYVVSEAGVATPTREGVWLGDNSLRHIDREGAKIYWSSVSGDNRLKRRNILPHGTSTSTKEVFKAPTLDAADADGFCMAYTPSNQTSFGCYASIPNGTGYRVNWRTVSVLDDQNNKDRPRQEREKICGWTSRMEGFGRMYARLQGVKRVIYKDGGYLEPQDRTVVEIQKGDRIEFWIDQKSIPQLYRENVTTDDINNTLEQERIASDNALQLGETFAIGKSLWRVVERTDKVFRRDNQSVSVILECYEIQGGSDLAESVGIVGNRLITQDIQNYQGDNQSPSNFVQANFFNLLKHESAIVRNQRPCDVTEIGIKSRVWLKFNGLCNFNTVLYGADLDRQDEDNVQITSGTMNLYTTRYSCFSLLVRKAGTLYDDNNPWVGVGGLFAVKGSTPVDQFNYIRIKPSDYGQYEYQLAPRTGAFVTRQASDGQVSVLNAAAGEVITQSFPTQYGNFQLTFAGELVVKESIEQSKFMWGPGGEGRPPTYGEGRVPNSAALNNYLSPQQSGQAHGYKWEKYGGSPDGTGQRETVTQTYTNLYDDNDTITLRFTAESADPGNWNQWGQRYVWRETNIEVVGFTGEWSGTAAIVDVHQINSRNPYLGEYAGYDGNEGKIRAVYAIGTTSGQVIIDPGQEAGTRFETDTQVTETSYYGDLITRSCDSGPEHQVAYVNETRSYEDGIQPHYDGMTTFGIELKASLAFDALNQPRIWLGGGIEMEKVKNGQFGSTNNFANIVYWLLTNETAGAGELISPELVDKETMIKTARFLDRNNVHFDGAIEEAINVRSFISEVAPFMLCSFSIVNGKFALIPAFPCDDSGNWDIPVPISAQFSEGNILEDSFELSFLPANERQDFRAEVTYRTGGKNQMFEQRTLLMAYRYQVDGTSPMPADVPIEKFDVSDYITRRGHAGAVARYLISLRRHVDHTIQFSTDPDEMKGVSPGSFIKVHTEMNPYFPEVYGVVGADGKINTPYGLDDGTHDVLMYRPEMAGVIDTALSVVDGYAVNEQLFGTVFTLRNTDAVQENVYQVEQVTLNEDMTVQVVASYHPVDSDGRSKIAKETFPTQSDLEHLFISLP